MGSSGSAGPVRVTFVGVLNRRLDAAFYLVASARNSGGTQVAFAVAEVRETLRAIRVLNGKVADADEWAEIHRRTNELERLLDLLKQPLSD